MAFQKAQGLGRDGLAGPTTLTALDTATRPAPRDPSGTHLEVDLGRQILLVVEAGQTKWVLITSTGNGEAYPSPRGGPASRPRCRAWAQERPRSDRCAYTDVDLERFPGRCDRRRVVRR